MLINRRIKCRLSPKGQDRLIKTHDPERMGIIVREDKTTYGVIWEGNKTQSAYHKSLIEKLENKIISR